MLFISLTTFLLAIAILQYIKVVRDDVGKLLGGLAVVVCVVFSLVYAPWGLKLLLLLVLLVVPTCLKGNQDNTFPCPRICLARGRCLAQQSNCFGWLRRNRIHTNHFHPIQPIHTPQPEIQRRP
ncbi:MAG: hypothetical protein VKK04_24565 [Synechococcales bacterium]|nr:hypothetical protein [Synechococcales bacterium]